jgi:hypothetical protein
MAQVVKYLPSKHRALSSTPLLPKKNPKVYRRNDARDLPQSTNGPHFGWSNVQPLSFVTVPRHTCTVIVLLSV